MKKLKKAKILKGEHTDRIGSVITIVASEDEPDEVALILFEDDSYESFNGDDIEIIEE